MPASTEPVQSSIRAEIDVCALVLGFLFVFISILITMPNDVLDTLRKAGLKGFIWEWFPILNAISIFTLCALMLLLTSILFYLVYQNKEKWWILSFARTFFAIGMYDLVFLTLLFEGVFLFRLFGKEGEAYMNPTFGIISFIGLLITLAFCIIFWRRLLPSLVSFLERLKKKASVCLSRKEFWTGKRRRTR